jgi:hypothetical protein
MASPTPPEIPSDPEPMYGGYTRFEIELEVNEHITSPDKNLPLNDAALVLRLVIIC